MPIDESKLIVSWNRYEQGLMKRHLMKCINDDDYCFGDEYEVRELYRYLIKHGILPQVNYNQIGFQQLVSDIKKVIVNHLKTYQGDRNFYGASDCSINDENETAFLTRFAMAVQDTKIRGQFIPENAFLKPNNYSSTSRASVGHKEITIAKAKLFSLATQLTRIGLNCKTTVHHAENLRGSTQNANDQNKINFIDTNNFLGNGVLKMNKLGIGMEPVKYYFNLYRKLFDLALKREWDQMQNKQKPKIPRFLIPLTHFWGQKVYNSQYGEYIIDINLCIKKALELLFKERYNATQKYGNLIAVDILDYNRQNNPINRKLFNETNWPYGRIIDSGFREPLFNQQETYEDYAIGSGDHYTFIGNECMGCWNGAEPSSHEAFAMKTNFPEFYGQDKGFEMSNGYYKIIPGQFQMPTDYQLHLNYHNDMIVPMNEINKGIKFDTKYGINNYYSSIQQYL